MKLRYRGTDFPDNEVRFGWDRRVNYSPLSRITKYQYRMLVRGERAASGSSAITTTLQELEDLVSVNNGDLSFIDNNGNNTVHHVNSSNTMNGVQVVGGVNYPISPPEGSRSQYLSHRTYEIQFTWEVEAPESEIVEWKHELQVGVGSEFVVKRSLAGIPDQQQTSIHPDRVAIQQGRAMGWSAPPTFPPPHFSVGFLLNGPSYQKAMSPLYLGRNGSRLYGIEWRYYFWSPVATPIGVPYTPNL
jgi:hypothetical protein